MSGNAQRRPRLVKVRQIKTDVESINKDGQRRVKEVVVDENVAFWLQARRAILTLVSELERMRAESDGKFSLDVVLIERLQTEEEAAERYLGRAQ
jgi:hypothetical protein